MQTETILDFALATWLGGLLIAAVASDWRSRRIPNALIVFGASGGLLLSLFSAGPAGVTQSLLGLLVGLLLLLPGFVLGFTGAGDVKLLAALGTFLGPVGVLKVFAVTAVLGAAVVLVSGLMRAGFAGFVEHAQRYAGMLFATVRTGKWIYVAPNTASTLSRRLPMAPLMATGVCIVLVSSRSLIGMSP